MKKTIKKYIRVKIPTDKELSKMTNEEFIHMDASEMKTIDFTLEWIIRFCGRENSVNTMVVSEDTLTIIRNK